MRTLLVDNYDSFTYNLYQYLGEVNGTEPVVLYNDAPDWDPLLLRDFDNVVLSPGPGTPERSADIGLCAELIRQAEIPVLGVCLGMQAIAHLHGAAVLRAPEPVHGRTSPVHHDGRELFAGLPNPLTVVRYHSLVVGWLPPELRVTATTDGIPMALRHRDRPLYGVQFHPESVCSENGMHLLRNFRDRTPRRTTTPSTPPSAVRARPPIHRHQLHVRQKPTCASSEALFHRFFADHDTAFFLDSNGSDRFSIMGTGSVTMTADVATRTVTTRHAQGTTIVEGDVFDVLAQRLACTAIDGPELPFDFRMGWVGYLGYELGHPTTHRPAYPDAQLVFADRAMVLDQHTGTLYLLALDDDTWLNHTEIALSTVDEPAPADRPHRPDFRQRHDERQYLDLIAHCQRDIAAGESYELCLTNQLTATAALDPWPTYRALRAAAPAPMSAYLRFGPLAVLSSSPERFLHADRHGTVTSSPIKGTRPRHADPVTDELARISLQRSEKDRAENLMIVDLVRNDLGRCARTGTVEVPELFTVRTFSTAHQLISTVRARLSPAHAAVDAVRAAFPPGSMTGAPKIRSMRILDELENGPRGIYSGAIGYLSPDGAADLSVVIRTLVLDGDRLEYGVGGAIVALSDPAEEYQETVVKTAPLRGIFSPSRPAGGPETTPATSDTATARTPPADSR